jgi:hypothetical protein
VKEEFGKLGGAVLDGIGYIPSTGDFFASLNRINFIVWSQDLKSLSSKVSEAVTRYGVNKVGVYLVAFDEVAPIFIGAHIGFLQEAGNHFKRVCFLHQTK